VVVDVCKSDGTNALGMALGRGLHSSTFRLNLSASCGIGVQLGVSKGC